MGRQFCILRGCSFPSAVFLELVTRREHLEDAWTSRSQVRDGTKVQGRVRKQGSMLRSKFINECGFQEQETGAEQVPGVEGEDYREVSFQGRAQGE